MLFVSQEERRASDTVLFTSDNIDMANQSVDTSFFNSEKNRMSNQLTSLARRDYFYLDDFWPITLGMYILMKTPAGQQSTTASLPPISGKKHKIYLAMFLVTSPSVINMPTRISRNQCDKSEAYLRSTVVFRFKIVDLMHA